MTGVGGRRRRRRAARAWYVSAESELRLGERYEEAIAAYEQPLAPGRDVAAADRALADWLDDAPVADFQQPPAHRQRPAHSNAALYRETRDNTIAKDFVAIDMLRAKLSFFGATRFIHGPTAGADFMLGRAVPADGVPPPPMLVYADGAL